MLSMRYQDTTPLNAAIAQDARAVALVMIIRGVNGKIVDMAGANALHIAARISANELVIALLKKGVSPNVKDKLGYTPLMRAASFCNTDVLKSFKKHTIIPLDITVKSPSGDSINDILKRCKNKEIMQVLTEIDKRK
jgi:ankyrin repeat protein